MNLSTNKFFRPIHAKRHSSPGVLSWRQQSFSQPRAAAFVRRAAEADQKTPCAPLPCPLQSVRQLSRRLAPIPISLFRDSPTRLELCPRRERDLSLASQRVNSSGDGVFCLPWIFRGAQFPTLRAIATQ